MFEWARRLVGLIAAASVGACTSVGAPPVSTPPAAAPAVARATFAIDVANVVDVLAKKPSVNWQDALLRYPPLVEARKANWKVGGRYDLKAASLVWDFNPGGGISSTPAYARDEVYAPGPNPYANDWLYVAGDAGTCWRVSPITGVAAATSPALPPMVKTAVVMNAGNHYVYLLSTTGFFTILDGTTLAIKYSQKISQSGFAGTAPYIDYSNGGGGQEGLDENVWALSTDGSLYRINVVTSTPYTPSVQVKAFPAGSGTDVGAPQPSWASSQPIPYGGAVTVSAGASPIVWRDRAYFGSSTGTVYNVDCTAAPAVSAWSLAPYTSAQGAGHAITAPLAFDVDGGLNVNAIFAPCGDRLVWLDPTSATNQPVASPPLLLDKVPPAPSAYADTLASFPYTTANSTFTAFDWVAVSSAAAPSPTRWGSGSAVAGAYNTGISCATVKRSPATGNMWVGQYVNPGKVAALTPAGVPVGTYNSPVANVNEICLDAAGNCYAAHGSDSRVVKFSGAGAVVQTFTMPSGYKAMWPEVDGGNNLWVTSGANSRVVKFSPAGAVLVNVAHANAMSVACDAAGNAYVTTDQSPGNVKKYSAAGAVLGTYAVGNRPMYVALEPTTGNIWTCNYGSNNVTKLSPAGAVLGTYNVGANQPWSIAFDADGLPWITCLSGKKVQKCSLTGAVLASFTMTGAPYEIAFDGNGDAWVSCADGLKKLYDLGNLADLFANTSWGVLGDGVDSYSLLKFRIPTNAYANTPPVGAKLTLTAATTPTSGNEDLGLFAASPFLPATATLWTGYGSAPNTDWSNRPSVSTALASLLNQAVSKDLPYDFPFTQQTPVDQVNTSDPAGGVYAYAHRTTSTTKVLKRVGHWYSNTTAPGAAQRPTLTVTRVTGATLSNAYGLRSQPLIDALAQKVYVAGCNAVFELSYASAAAWRDPAQVNYNVGQTGRAAPGPLDAGKFAFPPGNVLMTDSGKLIFAESNPSTSRVVVNQLTAPFDTNDKLAQFLDVTPATGTLAGNMLYDYDLGSVYLTTTNNHVVRADVQ